MSKTFFKQKTAILFGISALIPLVLLSYFFAIKPANKLHVYFLNVGEGDSALIKTPNHKLILVDAGPDNKVLHELGAALSFFDRAFDLVIATHPDKDHIGGLISVIDRYEVKKILMPGSFQNNVLTSEFFRKINSKKIPVILASASSDFDFGGSIKIDVLYPFSPMPGKTENTNTTSIVFRLIHPSITFLFTGDADESVEETLMKAGADLNVDVLKVGHHGSKGSTSEKFLRKTTPKTAVISVGKNSYGHPNEEVLARLKDVGAEILRTDVNGRIKMVMERQ